MNQFVFGDYVQAGNDRGIYIRPSDDFWASGEILVQKNDIYSIVSFPHKFMKRIGGNKPLDLLKAAKAAVYKPKIEISSEPPIEWDKLKNRVVNLLEKAKNLDETNNCAFFANNLDKIYKMISGRHDIPGGWESQIKSWELSLQRCLRGGK